MKRKALFLTTCSLFALCVSAKSVMSLRLSANDAESAESWRANFKAIAEHPGCCDEIWFSTGLGVPSLDWHRAQAAVLAVAVKDLRKHGIAPTLQIQATLGHSDSFGSPETFAMKTWTGWTDARGVETKYCNCPRQAAFLDYLREVSRIYAPLGFAGVWIDDDLRITNHAPADNRGRLVGCWCDTCLKAFNAETGANWTRAALAQAVRTDAELYARWRRFSIDAICAVARAIGEVFHAASPETMLAFQHASAEENVDQVDAVLKTLHALSERPVGFRPGGGAYYDENPNECVAKSLRSAWFRKRLGDPDHVKVWTTEIESWPRTYYSRSAQGVLAEGFTALMYGMNGISYFISDIASEDPSLYGDTYWKTLAAAAPVLHGYARTIDGCEPIGLTPPGAPYPGVRRVAVPVLAGVGRSAGALTKAEMNTSVYTSTSADIQRLRDALDARAGGLPAVVRSPFSGLMQMHVDASGDLRCVALMNLRISEQGPVRLLLRKVHARAKAATWNEMCRARVRLPLERTAEGTFVTIPSVGAWNGGYIAFE